MSEEQKDSELEGIRKSIDGLADVIFWMGLMIFVAIMGNSCASGL